MPLTFTLLIGVGEVLDKGRLEELACSRLPRPPSALKLTYIILSHLKLSSFPCSFSRALEHDSELIEEGLLHRRLGAALTPRFSGYET